MSISDVSLNVVRSLGLEVAIRTLVFWLLPAGISQMRDQCLPALEHLTTHRTWMSFRDPFSFHRWTLFIDGFVRLINRTATSGTCSNGRALIEKIAAAHQVTSQKTKTGICVVAVVAAKLVSRWLEWLERILMWRH